LRFFAIEEHRHRWSADGEDEWQGHNIRLGGYLSFKRAFNALMEHSKNGRIENEHRIVVALIQEGKTTFKSWEVV
jgi:hypothetical protein